MGPTTRSQEQERSPAAAAGVPFVLEPLPASFGAVVKGPRLPDLKPEAFQALYAAWLEYGLLIFPVQYLSREEQIDFARRFGPMEFDFGELSNVTAEGGVRPYSAEIDDDDVIKILQGNMGWHQDSTYMPVQAKGAVFSAVTLPSWGGETGFADMAAAYDALSAAEQRRLEDLTAQHSLVYSQAKVGQVLRQGAALNGYQVSLEARLRPLVKIHPETGRKSLAIGRHAFAVSGMAEAESEAFLAQLLEDACQPPRVWSHAWTPGDVVVWDNRRLLHRSLPWDMREPRVMWHSRIAGDPATETAL
jgi:alpha-ketoglutarate-dependent taurine dioxygenase